jgi:hypothetical protein
MRHSCHWVKKAAPWPVLFGLVLITFAGCRKAPSRWDQAQNDSEGKSAQEASTNRVNASEDIAQPAKGEALSNEPPPFTPGQPSAAGGPVDWKPKGADAADKESTAIDIAALTTGAPLPGGEFNRFFPKQSGNDDMVAKQEKEGFAQYSLRRDGEEIAQLSVTDLRGNPQAAEKFMQPDMTIADYPAKKDGSKGTVLLVEQRFQVKVRSPGGQLNESDRVKWLQAFDLAGIAGLAK